MCRSNIYNCHGHFVRLTGYTIHGSETSFGLNNGIVTHTCIIGAITADFTYYQTRKPGVQFFPVQTEFSRIAGFEAGQQNIGCGE
jgi:hypothetical protein